MGDVSIGVQRTTCGGVGAPCAQYVASVRHLNDVIARQHAREAVVTAGIGGVGGQDPLTRIHHAVVVHVIHQAHGHAGNAGVGPIKRAVVVGIGKYFVAQRRRGGHPASGVVDGGDRRRAIGGDRSRCADSGSGHWVVLLNRSAYPVSFTIESISLLGNTCRIACHRGHHGTRCGVVSREHSTRHTLNGVVRGVVTQVTPIVVTAI